ncbi:MULTISPECIES: DUF2339 domain-containing protein [Flavobacterium]|uniref:DUF2339 domain-containing protein n=1 Tax=Flavobacterium jumunjinense TaxID=998845 RepID=A0ABV5GP20_9FLAO|nr:MULTISPECIES: DUF2339 domain-containing protein [Flavobacterium]
METILLIGIILYLYIVNNNINIKFNDLQKTVSMLNDKLRGIQDEIAQNTIQRQRNEAVEKEVVKPVKPIIVEKPIEEIPIPKVEKVQPEIIKPIADKPIEVVAKIEQRPIVEKPVVPRPIAVPQKSWFETFKEKNPDLEKFIGENLINKIGILILVLGISFFVKFAIDKEWINKPARVGIGILCGSLVMVIAHKLKKNYAAFSSVLVAGAISIFYFTISIAFHDYHLFGQTVAFIIMVVITAFSTLVSVSYNRQELAVLSLIGGFAVPFMVSTGSGNYVVLLTYIAILNVGILGIAYFKKWKVVTVLAFLFTSILFASWYTNELYDNKLPHAGAIAFATIFYFIFSVIVVLNNIRNKGTFSVIEYFILVANTFFFFGMGMGIIHNWGIDFKGLFTLLLAFYNVIYAVILYKKFGLDKNAIYLLIGLSLTFVTLTIPIQFEGNQITIFWAAEAVLLFWLSQKSKIRRFKLGAIIVQVLTFISLVLDWTKYGLPSETLSIIINPLFISGFVVCVSFYLTYVLLKKEDDVNIGLDIKQYKQIVLVSALLLTYALGFLEIQYQAYQLIANVASAESFVVAYHFMFVALLLFIVTNKKHELLTITVSTVAVFSIVVYIMSFYSLPNREIIQNLMHNSNTNYALYFHYVILICLIYFGYNLFRRITIEPKIEILKNKFVPWLFVFAIVYILSNEIMIHGLSYSIDNSSIAELNEKFPKTTDDYTIQYKKETFIAFKLDDVKRQIIKIGYPILWGLFSFVFLIIGIKKQWKNLRIIALSLLGITILKLFIYDIKNVSETGKIIAFILLGVLILIISFVYQKIKKLVVDESPKSSSDEEV